MDGKTKLTTQRFTLERSCAALCQPELRDQRTTLSIVKLSVILSKSFLVMVKASWLSPTLKFKERMNLGIHTLGQMKTESNGSTVKSTW